MLAWPGKVTTRFSVFTLPDSQTSSHHITGDRPQAPSSQNPEHQQSSSVKCWPSQATPAVCIAKRQGSVEISPGPWSAVATQTLTQYPNRCTYLLLTYFTCLLYLLQLDLSSCLHCALLFSISSTLVAFLVELRPEQTFSCSGHI